MWLPESVAGPSCSLLARGGYFSRDLHVGVSYLPLPGTAPPRYCPSHLDGVDSLVIHLRRLRDAVSQLHQGCPCEKEGWLALGEGI